MTRLKLFCAGVLLAAVCMTGDPPVAFAGRIGGPISAPGIVPAYQSAFFTVPFAAGDSALVSVVSGGTTRLDLIVYDATGMSIWGAGPAEAKTAAVYVTGAGFFGVEVRNRGPVATSFILQTN